MAKTSKQCQVVGFYLAFLAKKRRATDEIICLPKLKIKKKDHRLKEKFKKSYAMFRKSYAKLYMIIRV